MGWWMAIPAVISAVSSISQANSANSQNRSNRALGIYNATAQRNISMNNISAQLAIGKYNAHSALSVGVMSADAQRQVSAFNAEIINATMLYNNSLLDNEESLMYEAMDLDLLYMTQARERERGAMIANQAASGTVIGEGSNADVISDQMTQEALDAFVIRHGADIQASKIANAQAQNSWNADVQIRKTIWEGEVGAAVTMANAISQSNSILANSALSAWSGRQSAGYQYTAQMFGTQSNYNTNSTKIDNGMTQGLFSAAGQGLSAYYAQKQPQPLNTGSLVASGTQGQAGTSLFSNTNMNWSGR